MSIEDDHAVELGGRLSPTARSYRSARSRPAAAQAVQAVQPRSIGSSAGSRDSQNVPQCMAPSPEPRRHRRLARHPPDPYASSARTSAAHTHRWAASRCQSPSTGHRSRRSAARRRCPGVVHPQAIRDGDDKAAPQGRAVVDRPRRLQRCAGTNVTSSPPTRTHSHQPSSVTAVKPRRRNHRLSPPGTTIGVCLSSEF